MSKYIEELSDGQNDAINSEFASYQHDIDMMLEENEMLKSHVAHLTTALKEARQAEMEACCRDICHDCRDGVKLNKVTEDEKGYYLHESPSGRVWMCWAYIIRQRWQQQEQGQ